MFDKLVSLSLVNTISFCSFITVCAINNPPNTYPRVSNANAYPINTFLSICLFVSSLLSFPAKDLTVFSGMVLFISSSTFITSPSAIEIFEA